jgi:hypothetical protein
VLQATILADATPQSGDAVATRRFTDGEYLVTFGRDVSTCAAIAQTRADNQTFFASTFLGEVFTGPNGVYVILRDHLGDNPVRRDAAFHLVVAC